MDRMEFFVNLKVKADERRKELLQIIADFERNRVYDYRHQSAVEMYNFNKRISEALNAVIK